MTKGVGREGGKAQVSRFQSFRVSTSLDFGVSGFEFGWVVCSGIRGSANGGICGFGGDLGFVTNW